MSRISAYSMETWTLKLANANKDLRVPDVAAADIVAAARKERRSKQEEGSGKPARSYLSLTIDDPSLAAPLHARLIDGGDGVHQLYWNRS